MEKLNMQAVLNATAQEDEFIKDFLISCGKVGFNSSIRIVLVKYSLI